MMRAFAGSIWIAITITMNTRLPVKRYLASATAARNASATLSTTTIETTITLFFRSVQNAGARIASVKWTSVGWSGIQCGVYELISDPGLNAVQTIQ